VIQCNICKNQAEFYGSVPTYNGSLVSNDFPYDLWANGGGNVPVCERCYWLHAQGRVQVWDYLYVPVGMTFIHGDGI
jgi:hypothetical protein